MPAAIDAWLESRLTLHRDRSVSEILLQLIHGGLRLREGYMAIHRRALERAMFEDPAAYGVYRTCLLDTFGPEYVDHLDRWLEADGVLAREAKAAARGERIADRHTHADGVTHAHDHSHRDPDHMHHHDD